MNILQACDDPALFRPWFKDPATWQAWRSVLASLFGLPMTAEATATYRECTGRADVPDAVTEAWLIVGRRGGKSFIFALIAVYLACFRSYTEYLQPGERGTIPILAADRRQARTIFRYIRAMLHQIPMLDKLIEHETADSFDLRNGVSIEISTASFRSARGYTVVAALCDEIAFWRTDDSANPDYEIVAALLPAMSTIPNALLIAGSSPYAKRGILHDKFKRHYGKPGEVLVWKAPTRVMNPSIKPQIIDAAIERDPASAASEYMAEFRSDIASFVDRDVVLACVEPGVRERGFQSGKRYAAFVDPSGGSVDSMTLAIGHREKDVVVIDVLRERAAPFDPENVVDEFAKTLKMYGVSRVTGDRYAGEWPRVAFRKRGIEYELSELPRSGLYQDFLPLLNAKTVLLLDNAKLVNQLSSLERKTGRGGKDSIDHSPGAHDDSANVVAGVATVAKSGPSNWVITHNLW